LAEAAGKKHSKGWLGRLVAGDHEAFAEFVDKYKETVFLCCRTLGLRTDEAEDQTEHLAVEDCVPSGS
jgi:hypothetical protein